MSCKNVLLLFRLFSTLLTRPFTERRIFHFCKLHCVSYFLHSLCLCGIWEAILVLFLWTPIIRKLDYLLVHSISFHFLSLFLFLLPLLLLSCLLGNISKLLSPQKAVLSLCYFSLGAWAYRIDLIIILDLLSSWVFACPTSVHVPVYSCIYVIE